MGASFKAQAVRASARNGCGCDSKTRDAGAAWARIAVPLDVVAILDMAS